MGKHHHDGDPEAGSIGQSDQKWIRQIAGRLPVCAQTRRPIPHSEIVPGIGRFASAVSFRPDRRQSVGNFRGNFSGDFGGDLGTRLPRIWRSNVPGVARCHHNWYFGGVRAGRRQRDFLAAGPRPPRRDRSCQRVAQPRATGADRSGAADTRSDISRIQSRGGEPAEVWSDGAAAIIDRRPSGRPGNSTAVDA